MWEGTPEDSASGRAHIPLLTRLGLCQAFFCVSARRAVWACSQGSAHVRGASLAGARLPGRLGRDPQKGCINNYLLTLIWSVGNILGGLFFEPFCTSLYGMCRARF